MRKGIPKMFSGKISRGGENFCYLLLTPSERGFEGKPGEVGEETEWTGPDSSPGNLKGRQWLIYCFGWEPERTATLRKAISLSV